MRNRHLYNTSMQPCSWAIKRDNNIYVRDTDTSIQTNTNANSACMYKLYIWTWPIKSVVPREKECRHPIKTTSHDRMCQTKSVVSRVKDHIYQKCPAKTSRATQKCVYLSTYPPSKGNLFATSSTGNSNINLANIPNEGQHQYQFGQYAQRRVPPIRQYQFDQYDQHGQRQYQFGQYVQRRVTTILIWPICPTKGCHIFN